MITVAGHDWLTGRRSTFRARGKEQARVWDVTGNIPVMACHALFASERMKGCRMPVKT